MNRYNLFSMPVISENVTKTSVFALFFVIKNSIHQADNKKLNNPLGQTFKILLNLLRNVGSVCPYLTKTRLNLLALPLLLGSCVQ